MIRVCVNYCGAPCHRAPVLRDDNRQLAITVTLLEYGTLTASIQYALTLLATCQKWAPEAPLLFAFRRAAVNDACANVARWGYGRKWCADLSESTTTTCSSATLCLRLLLRLQ